MANIQPVPGQQDANGELALSVNISEDATTGEALVVENRDAQVLGMLKSKVFDMVDYCVGIPFRQQWYHELGLLTETVYYSCTTMFFRQTIGEEYSGLLHGQRNKPANRLPSLSRRLVFLVCHSFVPYIYNRIIRRAERLLCRLDHRNAELKALLEYYLNIIRTVVEFAQKWHFSAFLMTGAFATLAQRMSRLQFMHEAARSTSSSDVKRGSVSSVNNNNDAASPKIITKKPSLSASAKFKWLGRLLFVCAAIQLYKKLRQLKGDKQRALDQAILRMKQKMHASRAAAATQSQPSASHSNTTGGGKTRPHCLLCLQETCRTSVTPCGHLYCWSCILEWVVKQPYCPACRQAISHISRIVYLQNFDHVTPTKIRNDHVGNGLTITAVADVHGNNIHNDMRTVGNAPMTDAERARINMSDAFFGAFDAEQAHSSGSHLPNGDVKPGDVQSGIDADRERNGDLSDQSPRRDGENKPSSMAG